MNETETTKFTVSLEAGQVVLCLGEESVTMSPEDAINRISLPVLRVAAGGLAVHLAQGFLTEATQGQDDTPHTQEK